MDGDDVITLVLELAVFFCMFMVELSVGIGILIISVGVAILAGDD